MNINHILVSEFNLFVEQLSKESLLGSCYECCVGFLRSFTRTNESYQITQVSNKEISILLNGTFVCEVTIKKAVCLFQSMEHFQEHGRILYNSLRDIQNDLQSDASIPCVGAYGKQYEYHNNGVFTSTSTTMFAIGFQHYVLYVHRSNGETYLLDPTISQFKHPPESLIICS